MSYGIGRSYRIYFLWLDKESAGIRNSADASATTVQNIPDSPDISLNDVSPTVHMETVYAADKNVTVDVSWEPHDGAMDSSERLECLYHGTGRSSQHILSMAGQEIPQESAKARRTQCNHVQNIPDSPIFRSTTCPLLP
jgi:hypothetical protein